MNNKLNKRAFNPFFYVLLVISAIVFVFSGFMLFSNIINGKKEQSVFDEMSYTVHQIEENTQTTENLKSLSKHYLNLKEQNDDFLGWITISDTQLDYPVMHTPNSPEYYLRRSFDKTYAISGTPFMDASCNLSSNAVMIYGHYMNNGTMFAILHSYKDYSFWEDHKTIQLDTTEERRTYEIVSAFYTEIKESTDTQSFKYYNYIGDLSDENFLYYADNVKKASLYDTGINIDPTDKLLTLSTCSYHHEYGRFVIVARLKNIENF